MFRIRAAQRDAFREQAIARFEAGAREHLARFFPDACRELGDAGVSAAVRTGIERAARHGIVAERDVCKFLDIMFVFGFDFDEALPWAREILGDPRSRDPFERMRLLHAKSIHEERARG
jgi:hypothetical protein